VTLYDMSSNLPRSSPVVVVGEGQWSVASGGVLRFAPEANFLTDPTPVHYRVTDANGLTDTAAVNINYLPEASDDVSSANALGARVAVNVLANDLGMFDSSSVRVISPVTGWAVDGPFDVAGEGTWAIESSTGTVTFSPLEGFFANPTPVDYQVTDVTGDTIHAKLTVEFVPEAADDVSSANALGSSVTVDVIGNDKGDLRAATVVLVDPLSGDRVIKLVVAGEGTWSVDAVSGAITFTPQENFASNPAPVTYEVADSAGNVTSAVVKILYLVAVVRDSRDSLATTGVDTAAAWWIATLLILAGVLLAASTRRRAAISPR